MPATSDLANALQKAADAIRTADALLIGAGAGMGVDSGLPDFRGDEGFWKAYPPFRGRRFAEMSNPQWFTRDPGQGWGFFGHRLHLYRDTVPHAGFATLRGWAESRPAGYFVFTSNVDGQFQKAGFAADRIVECHGSIHHVQCHALCCKEIWSAEGVAVPIDAATFRAAPPPLPACPHCGGVARPNILMFNDLDCLPQRINAQHRRLNDWFRPLKSRNIVAIEFGAGTAIPTVRMQCAGLGTTLIRVNPRDADVPNGQIGLPLGALEAIQAIDALIA